jgi:hypothetical protein
MCAVCQACPLPDDKIVIYGGEDSHRRPLAEAYVLDLQEFSWSKIQVTSKQQPVARSGHAATLVNNLLVIFGGEWLAGHVVLVAAACALCIHS